MNAFHPGLYIVNHPPTYHTCFILNFSIEALGIASDRNFMKITSNFGKVLTNERKLQADIHEMANALKSKLSVEQEAEKKILSHQISVHFQTIREIYIDM